jgi:thiamine transport system ATP-binding protein
VSGLEVERLTVRYGPVTAVDALDLRVPDGQVMALLGPSGCGKSSVLRAIAGLEPMAAGRVRFGGRDLSGVAVHRRDVGLMFQDHTLFPTLDVAGNVAFGLRMRGWPRDRARRRVAELLELVGLTGFGGRPVTALSGGEAQRVALARALAPRPRLLMLDEPLGALDRGLREQLTRELRRVLREVGQTALHVTHDQGEAFTVADEVAVMRAGRIMRAGRPAELWADPGDEFTARFLGHPNLWEVDVSADGSVRWGEVDLGRLDGQAPAGSALLLVPVGALQLSPGGCLAGVVEAVELRESAWQVTVASAPGRLLLRREEPPETGAEVRVAVDLAAGARLVARTGMV